MALSAYITPKDIERFERIHTAVGNPLNANTAKKYAQLIVKEFGVQDGDNYDRENRQYAGIECKLIHYMAQTHHDANPLGVLPLLDEVWYLRRCQERKSWINTTELYQHHEMMRRQHPNHILFTFVVGHDVAFGDDAHVVANATRKELRRLHLYGVGIVDYVIFTKDEFGDVLEKLVNQGLKAAETEYISEYNHPKIQ